MTDHNNRSMLSIALFSIALMSIVPVIIKGISANEVTIGIVRLLIAAIGIALLTLATKRKLITRRTIPWQLLLGLMFSLHWFTYFKSLKMSTVSLGAIGVATFGIHLLWLNRIFFKEPLKRSDYLAVLLAFAGAVLVTPDSNLNPDHFVGFGIAVFSGLAYATLPIINRKATFLSTEQKAFGQFGFGLLFFGPFAGFGVWQLSQMDWAGLLVLGLVCTLAGHTLWIKASSALPNSITATIYYVYIPIAMTLSVIFFDEQLGLNKLAGAGLIISANIMVVLLHSRAAKKADATTVDRT